MTTAQEFELLAQAVYEMDPLIKDAPWAPGDGIPPDHPRFAVIDTANNTSSGFQAMAVVPLKDGLPDNSQVHLAFAGTNPDDRADVMADFQTVLASQTGSASHLGEAAAFAEKVRSDARFKGARFETVGHSLGGFLALHVAAENQWRATTFNSPDPWDSLSPEARTWLTKQTQLGRMPLTNYVNVWDPIGNFKGNRAGAAVFVDDERGRDLFAYHNLDGGFDFDSDGAMRGVVSGPRSMYEIVDNVVPRGVPNRQQIVAGLLAAIEVQRIPAVGAATGAVGSFLMVKWDLLAAANLVNTLYGLREPLLRIKEANRRLIPRMQVALDDARRVALQLPYVTHFDVERVIAEHRLEVEHNIDREAVEEVDKLVDEHLVIVDQLVGGVGNGLANAIERDQQWSATFGSP